MQQLSDLGGKAPSGELPEVTPTQILVSKSLSFIIQKYIEKPYLIDKRKFDIRVWVLIN